MFDIIITGGKVFDGTGTEPITTDIGIKNDTITSVGDLSSAESQTVIDASGKYVSPGFVDVHSHSDTYLLIEPSAPSKIFQGITTEVVGNCGASAAPLTGNYQMPSDWADKEYPGKWSSVAEYRELLEQVKPALNVVLLIGHNTLHAGVVGYENRAVTEYEQKEMCKLLDKSLDEGGRGLSTGLIYPPGIFAEKEELIALANVVAKHDGILTSHMRSESKNLLDAIDEVISIGKEAGIRVEISHLKSAGKSNWHLLDDALALIRKSRDEGVKVCADRYPYLASGTDLDVIFPDWAEEGGREAILKRVRDKSDRARIREYLLESRSEDYWGTVRIGSTSHPDNEQFHGMLLTEVAERLGMEPVDVVLHLVDTDEVKTGAFFFGMGEDNMRKVFDEPYVMIGSDASLRATEGPLSLDYPHPRAYGTFPKFLRLALDGKTVALPEAIRKMTSLPAEQFKLDDRGIIAENKKADIIVFDPETVCDKADYSNPHQLAEGIDHVIVNGTVTIKNKMLTGTRAGKML